MSFLCLAKVPVVSWYARWNIKYCRVFFIPKPSHIVRPISKQMCTKSTNYFPWLIGSNCWAGNIVCFSDGLRFLFRVVLTHVCTKCKRPLVARLFTILGKISVQLLQWGRLPITSISLLELVVPSVEVYVKHYHGPRRQASQQKPKNSIGIDINSRNLLNSRFFTKPSGFFI